MAQSTDVVRHSPPQVADVAAMSDADLERMYRVAKALALSKRFPDARTADEAFAKVLLGRDLGMSPTQAMTGIHIVEGKPQIAAVSLAGFVRKSATYDYSVKALDGDHCRIEFYGLRWASADSGHGIERELLGVSEFTMAKARTAGLVKPKSNWDKYPENMLFARAISNGVKWFCPDLMGGVPIYTEGDTFEGSATEIASGHGDGSEPGWGSLSVEQVTAIERVLERARAVGHAGLADRATAQMTLAGQPDTVVAMWVSRSTQELDQFEAGKAAPHDEELPRTEAEHEAAQADLDRVLDRISAEEDAGADEAVLAPLRDEADRLERALGHDNGQETMGL